MSERDDALAKIVDIAQRNRLSVEDIQQALSGHATVDSGSGGGIVRRLLAYIGGIFVFAGVVVYIGMFWEEMNSAARIIITLGSGLVALVLSLLTLQHDKYAKAATPLFLSAACLQPTGMLVAFEELGSGGDPQHALLATTVVMLAQQLLILLRYPRPVLVFLALAFAVMSCWNIFDLLYVDEELNWMITGLSLILVSYGLDRTRYAVITPFWYFVGSASFLWASFELLENTSVHIFYLGITAFLLYVSTLARSRTLLFCSTVAMIGYLGYFPEQHFVDSVGWPITLVVMGLVLIGLSNLALRINRKYIAANGD
ncbi:MAG: DUF2157 domain-containing protein [Pseudomonadota bacterium]